MATRTSRARAKTSAEALSELADARRRLFADYLRRLDPQASLSGDEATPPSSAARTPPVPADDPPDGPARACLQPGDQTDTGPAMDVLAQGGTIPPRMVGDRHASASTEQDDPAGPPQSADALSERVTGRPAKRTAAQTHPPHAARAGLLDHVVEELKTVVSERVDRTAAVFPTRAPAITYATNPKTLGDDTRTRADVAVAAKTVGEPAGGSAAMPADEPLGRSGLADADAYAATTVNTHADTRVDTHAPAAVPTAVAALAFPRRLEQTLLGLLAGLSEKQVARDLSISPHTVHTYVKQIHKRLGVGSRGELLARFISAS